MPFVSRPSTPAGLAARHARRVIIALMASTMLGAAAHAQDSPAPADLNLSGAASSSVPAGLAQLPVERQVAWLEHAAQNGEFAPLSDAQLIAVFQELAPDTVPRYVRNGSRLYWECEFHMFSQQRVRGVWQIQPAHMLVRYRRQPRQVYVKWLADGRNAGQETIYDELKDAHQLYAHQGGLLQFVAMWTSIDSARALAQSNHTVRELGIDYVTEQFLSELEKYRAAGVEKPTKIEVLHDHGTRIVAFTWETPSGQPEFYAKRERLGLDLRHPFFRTVEAWDNQGEIFEKFSFLDVTPKHFDDATFDPKNPEYAF